MDPATYRLSPKIQKKVRNTVLITGSARSGTSIFGKLFGSLDQTEYFFEPSTLFSFFSVLETLPVREARLLFDTFVYEELLVGALSGRGINLRRQDDSSIRNTKSEAEIARRLESAARKDDLNTHIANIAIKMPDFVNRLPVISHTLGLHRLVILIRDPSSTINSLLRRGWFTDRSLQSGAIVWPNYWVGQVPVPHWVPADWLEAWSFMSERDRAALYYITQTELPDRISDTSVIFDYSQMLDRPRALLGAVADHFGLDFGCRTGDILATVGVQDTTEPFELSLLCEDLRERVIEAYRKAIAHSLQL